DGTSDTRAKRLASTRVSNCIAALVATSCASATPPVEDTTSRTVSLLYSSVSRPKSSDWADIDGPVAIANFSCYLLWIVFRNRLLEPARRPGLSEADWATFAH